MRTAMGCALILATLASAACHTMSPVALDQLRGIQPNRVWVTRGDQSVVVVSNPQVLGDTLVGFVNRKYQVMPLASLKQLRVARAAPRRTAALVVAGIVGLAVGGYMAASSGASVAPKDTKCDTGLPEFQVMCQ
jgi:hypothetical protein